MTNRKEATLIVLKTELVYLVDDFNGSPEARNKIYEALDLYHDCVMGMCTKRALKKYEMRIAKQMLANWLNAEYAAGKAVHFCDDIPSESDVSIAYTELGDENQYPVQVFVNFWDRTVNYCLTDGLGTRKLVDEEKKYGSLDEMMDRFLEYLDFDDLIGVFGDYIED